MARSFGRVFTTIWDDDDFRALSPMAQRMYMFLVSQADLEHSGLIPLRERRWARACGALDVSQVTGDLKELESARFVITDDETEELLVRSLIRRDEIWKQPNVFKAAAASATSAKSSRIKSALWAEIQRLDFSSVGEDSRRVREGLLTALEPFATHQPTHPEGFARGSEVAQGEGERLSNGSYHRMPLPPSSDPPPPGVARAGTDPERPALVQVPGEGDQNQPETPDRVALVAEIRSSRPDWSTGSINRALNDRSVIERPWPLVKLALRAVAADPKSQAPGRLAHDGPWWNQRPLASAADRSPWCGECDERTRMTDGDNPRRCPDCGPRALRGVS